RSLSITPEGQRAEAAFVREALSRMRRNDRAGVIAFAGSPLLQVPVEAHPAVEDLGRPIDPDATDIGAALGLGQRMLGEAGARRIVLLSDGAENRGDAAAAARVARAAGVAVDAAPITAGRPEEVLVDAVTAPQEVRAGGAYEIRAVVRPPVPPEAAVTLSRHRAPVETPRLRLAPGQTA